MLKSVREITRFSDGVYPHLVDDEAQARIYPVAAENPESTAWHYAVDHRDEVFLFTVYKDWVADIAADEKVLRLTLAPRTPRGRGTFSPNSTVGRFLAGTVPIQP